MQEKIEYEVKRQNRFIVTFPDGNEIESWMIKRANKPKYNTHGWETIEIVFIDMISPSVSQILFKLLDKDSMSLVISITLEMLDPTGIVVEKWVITGEITSIDFGELDYANENAVELKIIIKPSTCVLDY